MLFTRLSDDALVSADFIAPLLEAVAHQEAGRFDAASAGFSTVLDLEPEQPQALFFAGVLALRTGRTATALGLLERSVQARPTHAESHVALGNALWAVGRKAAARTAWQDALRHERRHLGALLNLARAQEEAGESEAAVACCRLAIEAKPGNAQAHAALASALRADAQLLASLRAAETASQLDPGLAQAHYQRGTTLKLLGRLEDAVNAIGEALRLAPADASSHLNLANLLFDLNDPAGAEHHCRAALVAEPRMAEGHAMLGYLLTRANRLPEAIEACAEAVRLAPNLAEGHWNKGIALLTSGDLPAGFAEYEWRKRHPRYCHEFRSLPTPEWDGGNLAGKRLLILAEQGLGDAIMFARYPALLRARGAHVTLACDRRLVPLLQHAPGAHAVIPNRSDLPEHDIWVDQMSLPLRCGTTLATIPSPGPYLAPDPAKAAAWSTRLPARSEPIRRVGIAWAGNPLHSNDANRSCTHDFFAPLSLLASIRLISLQVGDSAPDAAQLGLHDWSPNLTDYAETAGLIANLDLVITVDTSVAHLAAAMGVPTWILLPFCPDWRWLQQRSDSPWYSSVRLFRQRKPGDWTSVSDAVVDALLG